MGEKVSKKIFAEGVTVEDLCDMFSDIILQSLTKAPLSADQLILCGFIETYSFFIGLADEKSLFPLLSYMFQRDNSSVEKGDICD